MFAELLLAGLLGCGWQDAKSSVERISISREELFHANLFLVAAEAREPKEWKVQEVYVGPAELKGKTIFGEFVLQLAGSFHNAPNLSPASVGSGLFWVCKGDHAWLEFHGALAVNADGFFYWDYRLHEKVRF